MRLFRMILTLSCVALLAFGNLTWDVSENAAQASASVAQSSEMEPNNEPLSANEIPFPGPGQTVTVTGSVRAGDQGSFSEELETFFAFAGGIGAVHDWYVADPDAAGEEGAGPFPLKVSLSWTPGETDLDVFAGQLVDDSLFFFDGFKYSSGFELATLANPETWPNPNRNVTGESLAVYLQPNGVAVNNTPIPNDGFGRKLVFGVLHFDGPPANYTLTIQRGPAVAKQGGFASELHQVDDGGITTSWFSGPQGLIVLNRYKPTRYPATITSIQHPFVWFGGVPNPTGQPLRVLVLAGNDDSLNAAPPALTAPGAVLFDQMVNIPGTISSQQGSRFIDQVVDIPLATPITINSGVAYVGIQLPNQAIQQTGVAVAMGTNPTQYLRTYISTDNGATWGRPVQTDDNLSGEDLFANADIRAVVRFGGAAKTSRPSTTRTVTGPSVPAGQVQQSIGIRPLR